MRYFHEFWLSFIAVLLFAAGPSYGAEGNAIVFGGSGHLGSEIVKLLVEAGNQTTVFVRPTSDRSRLDGLDVSYAVGDVINEDDVAAALQETDFDVIINTIAKRMGEPVPHENGQRHINKWAKETGVGQVIFLSSVGAGDNASVVPENMQKFQEPFRDQLIDKGVAEVELRESGLNYTIIRTGAVIPVGAEPTGQGQLVEDESVIGPITRPDLAVLVIGCVLNPDCKNKIYHSVDESLTGAMAR